MSEYKIVPFRKLGLDMFLVAIIEGPVILDYSNFPSEAGCYKWLLKRGQLLNRAIDT